ncbi:carboxymuconolactone decarboxylase family protein [candidate division KSB1 bacterium]|nr:carboxymuconolactone decarboxylase family protein [candidate division KSB1 bacterium]
MKNNDNNLTMQEYDMAEQRMKSYEMIPERFKKRYLDFYDELYHPERSVLDLRTKELVAIAASVTAGCQGCFRGHVLKAVRAGATREEIGEAISVAVAINAATVVDRTDIANEKFDLVRKLWENGADNLDDADKTTP